MKIYRGLHNAQFEKGCVLTIGNFDGVHLGHQALLRRLSLLAQAHGLPSALLLFEPHPVELLAPHAAPARLTRFREKMQLLMRQPVEHVVCAPFNQQLAQMNAEDFIQQVLCKTLQVRHLLVGDDFRFGHQGAGDFTTLQAHADAGHFELTRVPTVSEQSLRVSSTRIRELVTQGELTHASQLLGREVSICGRVAYGQQLGRTIGFPTANFALRRISCALSGVYAVSLRDAQQRQLDGVANVGTRPTVNGDQSRVEVHVFDFDGDLYGQSFQVIFHQRIRQEQRFNGLDALRAQIALDVDSAREIHSRRGA